jgi:hypothetical protein
MDVYLNTERYESGHRLWRSLNAVVILKKQMRQANDPEYASLLSRIRIRSPTDADIELLNSRIGAVLQNMSNLPVIVRRHSVRHAINLERLQQYADSSHHEVTHCIAVIRQRVDVTIQEAYRCRYGEAGMEGDAVLTLAPGVPLLITKNISQSLGTFKVKFLIFHTDFYCIGIVNGAIVKFFGWSNGTNDRRVTNTFYPPEYMLVQVSDSTIAIPGLPPSVVPLHPTQFTRTFKSKRKVTFRQFPVTLAFAITDYKCQGETYPDGIIVDIKQPSFGSCSASSPYVQLSRCQSFDRLSILRPFNPEELRTPLSQPLSQELEWQKVKAMETVQMFQSTQ